jgi:epoxyqueuosine reductase
MSGIFMGTLQYAKFKGFAAPQKKYPWAKSIIVLSRSITKYNVPVGFEGMYGKHYMFDERLDENSGGWKARQEFKAFLEAEGIMCVDETKFGITGLRWAAYKAGIGCIRQNNFFYTDNSGSYCALEAWLIDSELEQIEEPDFKPCPDNCGRCIEACPTKSLKKPYTMSLIECAGFKNSISPDMRMGNTRKKTACKFGRLVYGCGICQDVCPFNEGKHVGGEDFPGLAEISEFMRPEKIMTMTYKEIDDVLADKYWYISRGNLWKWKLNALTYMMNNYIESYGKYINLGLQDSDKRVRNFSKKILKEHDTQ